MSFVAVALVLLLSAGLSLCLVSPVRAGTAEKEALSIVEAELVKVQAKKSLLQAQPQTDETAANLHRLDADVASLKREIVGWQRKLGLKTLADAGADSSAGVESPKRRTPRVRLTQDATRRQPANLEASVGAGDGLSVNLAMARDLSTKTAGIWEAKP
jgi:hypothetical protein